jgi:hypothetical protein
MTQAVGGVDERVCIRLAPGEPSTDAPARSISHLILIRGRVCVCGRDACLRQALMPKLLPEPNGV